MSTTNQALVIVGQNELAQGGQGINYGGKFAELTPATLNIVQTMSDAFIKNNVKPGTLFIKETEEEFTEMTVALLAMPREFRDYHVSEQKTPESRMCFSRDNIKPDDRAVDPQAALCGSCGHNPENAESWTDWRNSTLPNAQKRHLIPKCDSTYYAVFIDTVNKLPLQMFVKGASKVEFEKGMKNVMRTLLSLKASGKNPNIFDVRFKLSSVPGNQKNFVLKMTEFKPISPEEREAFGPVFTQYVNGQLAKQRKAEQPSVDKEIASELSEPETVQEYVEI